MCPDLISMFITLGSIASIYRVCGARYLQLAKVTTQTGPRTFGKSILFDDKSSGTPQKSARPKQDRASKARSANGADANKRFPRSSKALSHRTASRSSGFVRAGKQRGREGVADGSDSRQQKGQKTLTTKTLREKTKWHQSEAGQAQLRERLNDLSLAGWQRRKIELKLKIGGDGWEPEKKIATSSMEKIRLLNAEFPEEWTMQRLSEQFKISQESVRRILKSKFQPSKAGIEEREDRRRQQMAKHKTEFKRGSPR
ncbi:hypothetical protein H4S08_000713 [Coemansia sp. RSA 1365]|nr:hypothetical protein H4S08_000713 [Coemansia sp. RSA 1365]